MNAFLIWTRQNRRKKSVHDIEPLVCLALLSDVKGLACRGVVNPMIESSPLSAKTSMTVAVTICSVFIPRCAVTLPGLYDYAPAGMECLRSRDERGAMACCSRERLLTPELIDFSVEC